MKYYHGTTEERYLSIVKNGLRKGTFVTPDFNVARIFAISRSNWNKQPPIILVLEDPIISKVVTDRSGRLEAQLKETTHVLYAHRKPLPTSSPSNSSV